QPGYVPGAPIRLISCSTGAWPDGIAQQLANIMHVDVLAPTTDLDGHTGEPLNGGRWERVPAEPPVPPRSSPPIPPIAPQTPNRPRTPADVPRIPTPMTAPPPISAPRGAHSETIPAPAPADPRPLANVGRVLPTGHVVVAGHQGGPPTLAEYVRQ